MTDKWRNVTISHGVANCAIDEVSEEGNAVFKVVVRDLHDARGELKNSDVGRLVHFGGGVEEAVSGNPGVTVD